MPHEEIDWTGIDGPDDFVQKAERNKAEVVAKAKKLVGDDKDPHTNAGQLRWLAESSIESPPGPDQSGYTVVLQLEKVAANDPQTIEERLERMAINREALDYFYDLYRIDRDNAQTKRLELSNGSIELQTTYPSSGGFAFVEGSAYIPGHDPDIDPIPDFFGVVAHSLVDGEAKGGIFNIPPSRKSS
jgi:hypothetical protein